MVWSVIGPIALILNRQLKRLTSCNSSFRIFIQLNYFKCSNRLKYSCDHDGSNLVTEFAQANGVKVPRVVWKFFKGITGEEWLSGFKKRNKNSWNEVSHTLINCQLQWGGQMKEKSHLSKKTWFFMITTMNYIRTTGILSFSAFIWHGDQQNTVTSKVDLR